MKNKLKWINVNDGLPNVKQNVLVKVKYDIDNVFLPAIRTAYVKMHYNCELGIEEKYFVIPAFIGEEFSRKTVTHWISESDLWYV
jgi:hypothetical protein